MYSKLSHLIAAVALAVPSFAQTPSDFQPNSLVELGVIYPQVEIEPAGSQVPTLQTVGSVPRLTVPKALLQGNNGAMDMGKKFMVFMIDIDVVRGNTGTTVLHWFQPDLMPDGDNLVLFGNTTGTVLLKQNKDVQTKITQRQAPPLPPGAPSGPDTIDNPDLLGATAQAVYFGPMPPPGPPHRYVQVLFEQPPNFKFPACFQNILEDPNTKMVNRQGRLGFDINQFLKAARIPPRPIAGNYFRAQNPTPGSLNSNATTTSLRNNMCAAAAATAAPAPMAPPPPPPMVSSSVAVPAGSSAGAPMGSASASLLIFPSAGSPGASGAPMASSAPPMASSAASVAASAPAPPMISSVPVMASNAPPMASSAPPMASSAPPMANSAAAAPPPPPPAASAINFPPPLASANGPPPKDMPLLFPDPE